MIALLLTTCSAAPSRVEKRSPLPVPSNDPHMYDQNVVFSKDFTYGPKQVFASRPVNIVYETARAKCAHDDRNGVDTFEIYGYYQISNSKINSWTISQRGQKVKDAVSFALPRLNSSTTLSVWFECKSTAGDVYDSDFGKNYQINVV